jgi:Tfp pilus assembly protein PilN
MKPLVNFANDPFRNRRLFWLLIALIVAVSAWVGLSTLGTRAQLEQQIVMLEPRVQKLEAQKENGPPVDFTNSTLTIGQNQALIVAQDLIARKSFSWSQLLNDLERYIPPAIRVTRIAVERVGQAKGAYGKAISLSFDVVGKSATEVTAMIKSLNESGKFSVFPQSQKQVEGTEEYEFQLGVEYRPPSVASSGSLTLPTQVATQGGGTK